MEYRYRLKDPHDAELRGIRFDQEKPKTLTGYAVVYNSPSEDLGGFVEIVQPGAFVDCLRNADLRALVDHDWGRLLGRQSSGTLRLFDEPKGLRYELDLPDTQDARDIASLIDRGDLDGMSFCMTDVVDRWEGNTRFIVRANIREISVVTLPAYEDTSIALRSRDEARAKADAWRHDLQRLRLRCAEIAFK